MRVWLTRRFWLLRDELGAAADLVSSAIPGKLGWWVRRRRLARIAEVASGVMIDEFVRIEHPRGFSVGKCAFIGRGALIHAGGGVRIGSDVLIGPGVKIWSVDHVFSSRDVPIRLQGHEPAPVCVGDDAWLGVDCIVLKGVTIGRGAVIGAGSVVTKDIPDFSIAVGVPARVVGKR